MKPQQIRVRKFRPARPSGSRSTDGIRRSFRDDAITRARAAQQRATQAKSATDQEGQP